MRSMFLNIGLNGVPYAEAYTNGTKNDVTAGKALACVQALRRAGFVYLSNRLVYSDSEPTLAIEVVTRDETNIHGRIRSVAAELAQEVIACWKDDLGVGVMLGKDIDHDDSWGAFNPELFFLPTGRRLSQTLSKVQA